MIGASVAMWWWANCWGVGGDTVACVSSYTYLSPIPTQPLDSHAIIIIMHINYCLFSKCQLTTHCIDFFKSTDDNDDGLITAPDIENVVLQLCGTNTFSAEDLEQLVQHVLNEAEGRESDAIGPQEFRNIISRAPDFALNFTIRF